MEDYIPKDVRALFLVPDHQYLECRLVWEPNEGETKCGKWLPIEKYRALEVFVQMYKVQRPSIHARIVTRVQTADTTQARNKS